MFSVVGILAAILTAQSALAFSPNDHYDQACLTRYNGTLDNNYLIGNWYAHYKWSYWLNLPASTCCPSFNFTVPVAEELEAYKAHYTDPSKPHDFSSVVKYGNNNNGVQDFEGMLLGGGEVKFWVLPPNYFSHLSGGYSGMIFKRITDDYMLYMKCDLMNAVFWLYGKPRHPTDEELKAVIANISEIKRMESKRYCA